MGTDIIIKNNECQSFVKKSPLKVFIINGHPRSGKDEFVKCVQSITKDFSYNYSSVDNVKEALKLLGWDGIKNKDIRALLANLKQVSINSFDGPFKYCSGIIDKLKDESVSVFFHVREPSEIDKLVCYATDNGIYVKTIFVRDCRENNSDDNSEISAEKLFYDVEDYTYDLHIDNNFDREYIQQVANLFVQTYIIR